MTQISCNDCGLCCMHMSSPPYSEDETEELKQIAPHVYADLIAVERTRELQWNVHGVDEIPCGFLDTVTRKCRHHGHHPDICRDFEAGEDGCLAYRTAAGFEV